MKLYNPIDTCDIFGIIFINVYRMSLLKHKTDSVPHSSWSSEEEWHFLHFFFPNEKHMRKDFLLLHVQKSDTIQKKGRVSGRQNFQS